MTLGYTYSRLKFKSDFWFITRKSCQSRLFSNSFHMCRHVTVFLHFLLYRYASYSLFCYVLIRILCFYLDVYPTPVWRYSFEISWDLISNKLWWALTCSCWIWLEVDPMANCEISWFRLATPASLSKPMFFSLLPLPSLLPFKILYQIANSYRGIQLQ